MATIKSTLALQDRMTPVFSSINRAMNSTLRAIREVKGSRLGPEFAQASADIRLATNEINKFNDGLDDVGNKSTKSFGLLGKALKGVAIGYTLLKGIQLSDQLTGSEARLRLIKREGEEVDNLTEKIYQSAQSSRAAYTDVLDNVTKLGLNAQKSFSSTDEIIRFTELLNKSFVVGGAGATEQAAAMYQLTQAMSSGRLQGDEYRSIIENAPQLAKAIEDYMINVKKAKGTMKEWASDGLLTADVIKAALFSSADAIEEKFGQMEMTFGQAWTIFKNSGIKALQPVLKMATKLLNMFTKVFDFIAANPEIFYILAAAAAALGAAYLVMNAATITTTISQWALNSAMLACPITWIILALTALALVLLYLWKTNDEAAYYMLYAWDAFLIGLKVFALGFKGVWYGLLDFLGYFKIGGLAIIDGFINGAITLINGFIALLNNIPGVAIDAIDYQSTLAIDAATKFAEEKAGRDADLAATKQEILAMRDERNATRDERVSGRKQQDLLEELNSKFDGVTSSDGKSVKTKNTEKLLTDEDIKLLLDVATRDYKLSYQSITPNVQISFGDVRETADVDVIVDKISEQITEFIDGKLVVASD